MDNKLFLILRYIIVFGLIFLSAFTPTNNLNIIHLTILLLYIINTQIRYFLLRDRNVPIFISISLDFIFAYILYNNFNIIFFPFILIGIMDAILILNNKLVYLIYVYVLVSIIYGFYTVSIFQMISNLLFIISMIFTCNIINIQDKKNLKSEEIYYKLKESEEKLVKNNKDLENDANSFKELSTLKERNRISREIHDSVGHSLSTIIIQLGAIEKIAEIDGKTAANMAQTLSDFAKNGLSEIRNALQELKPKEYNQYEPLIAIESLIKDFNNLSGIDVKLGFSKERWIINEDAFLVMYRAIQEFLSNSLKHGKSTRINIFIHFNEDHLILTLKDNGIGADDIEFGIGLTSLFERVKEINGTIHIESKKGNGFFLRIVLNR